MERHPRHRGTRRQPRRPDSGAWSDGATLWLAENGDGADDAVYAYDLESGERVEDREFELDQTNRTPRGVWSDRTTIWVSDSGQNRLFAHDLETGARLEERDITLADRNRDARGIWSGDETMWVLDGGKDSIFAYDLTTGDLLAEYELASVNDDPHGIWSDGVTVWVSDHGAKRLFAYRLPARPAAPAAEDTEPQALERVIDEEFKELSKASNNSPRGLWSDGDVMYVADESDDKVYSYNMPKRDRRAPCLAHVQRCRHRRVLKQRDGVHGHRSGRHDGDDGHRRGAAAPYECRNQPAGCRRGCRGPPGCSGGPHRDHRHLGGRQPDEDLPRAPRPGGSGRAGPGGSRAGPGAEPAPRKRQDPWRAACAATSPWASASSSTQGAASRISWPAQRAGTSRRSTRSTAASGCPTSSGAPEFVNEDFRALFADSVPALTPLTVKSDGPATAAPVASGVTGPWAACLRGEIVEGFNLVLYEGGSVDDLDACAEGVGLAALYVLDDGVWVSYILGAPEFVNRSFRELFADGLPVATPLVGKSD